MSGSKEELQRLAWGIKRCRKCPLHKGRKHAVPGEGAFDSPVMLIGEAPGEIEDLEGRPFVGRSGRFLDALLAQVGIDRDRLFITSAVKCRPLDNRNPNSEELSICREAWLVRQIQALNPEVVVLMGKIALAQVLNENNKIAELHGATLDKQGRKYFITYHPSAGMRFPKIERAMSDDFIKLKEMVVSL